MLQYTFTANGTYTIELVVTNECGEPVKVTVTLDVDCICPPPVRDFTFNVECHNREGIVTFNVVNGQPGDSYTWNFGDGSPNLTNSFPLTIGVYTVGGTYTVTLTTMNSCGETSIVQHVVNIICDALCPPSNNKLAYLIDGRNGGITLSQAFSNLGIPFNPGSFNVFNNMHLDIWGTVSFDISAEFIKSDFVAYNGAEIILDPSATGPANKGLNTFFGCNFYGCQQMWRGIRLEGHTANFLGGSIRDAHYGIHILNDGHLTVRGVTLSHNFVGIMFESNPSHLIVGNHFTGGSLLPAYAGMPSYGNKNLCGIYSAGVVYNDSFTSSSGTYSLNVGQLNDVRNTFDHMRNGIICNQTFNINIKNNAFLNLPIADLPTSYDFNLNTEVDGIGVMVRGGGFFGGVYFEDNRFENGTQGILARGIPSLLSVKNNNKFYNLEHGIHAIHNGWLFPLNLIVENNNEFNCRSKGIFSNSNAGHNFKVNGNTFTLSSLVDKNNPAGFHALGQIPGFFGKSGDGQVYSNDFFIGAVNFHSNGGLQVSNYRGVDMSGMNVFHFLTPSPTSPFGHGGYTLSNLDRSIVRDNELYNFSGLTFSGVNSINNSVNNAICCNKTYSLSLGLALRNSETSKSTFKQNEMFENSVGLSLDLNCAIGDQVDHGNIWTGVSRVARHVNIDTDKNAFLAEDDKNNSQRSLWPDQLPSIWFMDSDVMAVEECDDICSLPLSGVTEGSPPSALNTQTLENMLNHDHIVIADHLAPSVWSKERWLYGYLTKYPAFLESSDVLSSFYASVSEDVYKYENFYGYLSEILTPSETTIADMASLRFDAQTLLTSLDDKWRLYQVEPNAALEEEMTSLKESLSTLMTPTAQFGHAQENQFKSDLEMVKSQISALPDDKPYTSAAKQYASILLDKLIYGEPYVISHHLGTLQALAHLCEPLYKETVVLSRNMLASLGYEAYYNDVSCSGVLESRSAKQISESDVSLTPNPTTGMLYLDHAKDIRRIYITDTKGALMKHIDGNVSQIDLSELHSGIYFVKILTDDNESLVKKIIKIQ